MDHAPTSLNTKLLAATILGAVVLLGAVGALYQHAEKQIGTEFLKQHQTTTELAGKLADLDTRLSALTSAPPPAADTTVTDQLRQDLTAAQTTITHLNDRISALEKKQATTPVEAPAKPISAAPATTTALIAVAKSGNAYLPELIAWQKEHPQGGDAITHLRMSAATGLVSEERLRRELHDRLTSSAQTAPEEGSWMARLNQHVGKLVSIRKQPDPASPLANLSRDADTLSLTDLIARIGMLPADQQSSFASWVETARNRQSALDELNLLPTQDRAP